MNSKKIRMICILAMLCAVAITGTYFSRMLPPITPAPPLKYDPKDIFIIIGGFIYGPLVTIAMSLVVSLIEMITFSTTGPYGFLMNVVSTCAIAFPAAAIYRKMRTIKGAVIGLVCGVVSVVAVMMLWNYIITPFYLAPANAPREVIEGIRKTVVGMLMPVFLPFNFLKGALNAALIMIIYKPLMNALRIMRMLPENYNKGKANIGVLLASLFAVMTFVLLTLVFMGII